MAAVALLVTIGVLWFAGGDTTRSDATSGGVDPALEVPFTQFDGQVGTLDAYVGTPIVVNFFASWCTPCIAELPRFEAVHQEFGDRVEFVGLNLQDDRDAGLAVIAQTGISYDVGRDPQGAVFTSFEGFAMPTTVFIDAGGRVVEVWSGELSGAALRERIEEVLL